MGKQLTKDQEKAKKLLKELGSLNDQLVKLEGKEDSEKEIARLLKRVAKVNAKLAKLEL